MVRSFDESIQFDQNPLPRPFIEDIFIGILDRYFYVDLNSKSINDQESPITGTTQYAHSTGAM